MSVMTGKVDAIWTPQDNTIASAFSTVISLANQAKIPVYTTVDTMVKEGGLASVASANMNHATVVPLRFCKGK
ncbi:MAG: ABC transporter substrate binding protein [Streptococcus thermophilus]